MSTHSLHSAYPVRARRGWPMWTAAKPLWAGLSIISMWLAVLFVGVFGGNIVSTGATTSSSVPVVVVVAGVALIASVMIGRRAFTAAAGGTDLWEALETERLARHELEATVAELRTAIATTQTQGASTERGAG